MAYEELTGAMRQTGGTGVHTLTSMDGISRRARIDLLTPAETAIRVAMIVVEEVGADPLLTDAVNLLQQARDRVADYVDGKNSSDAKLAAFLDELTTLSRKHGYGINRTGELYELELEDAERRYRCDDDSRINFV